MIGKVCLAIEMGCAAVDIGKTIHPHPTLGETVGMAAEVAHASCTDVPPPRKKQAASAVMKGATVKRRPFSDMPPLMRLALRRSRQRLYFAAMQFEFIPDLPRCPDPLARAPRAFGEGVDPHARLYLAPPALQGVIVAVICRDTRGLALDDWQLLSHFPASPLLCLSCFQDVAVGLVERTPGGSCWRPFSSSVVFSGSQSRPLVSWAPGAGRGVMVCFTADVGRALSGLDPALIHDRFVEARDVLGAEWRPFFKALRKADDDAATLAVLERYLAAPWQALQGGVKPLSSLRRLGRHWVERLTWQAHTWRRTQSTRQVERRIRDYSGRSLREWQSLVQTEGLFFAARDRHEAGKPFDWASLAQEEGFADQPHMSRAAKRITGFAPTEFARRFVEDESFWLYRLWV